MVSHYHSHSRAPVFVAWLCVFVWGGAWGWEVHQINVGMFVWCLTWIMHESGALQHKAVTYTVFRTELTGVLEYDTKCSSETIVIGIPSVCVDGSVSEFGLMRGGFQKKVHLASSGLWFHIGTMFCVLLASRVDGKRGVWISSYHDAILRMSGAQWKLIILLIQHVSSSACICLFVYAVLIRLSLGSRLIRAFTTAGWEIGEHAGCPNTHPIPSHQPSLCHSAAVGMPCCGHFTRWESLHWRTRRRHTHSNAIVTYSINFLLCCYVQLLFF